MLIHEHGRHVAGNYVSVCVVVVDGLCGDLNAVLYMDGWMVNTYSVIQ